jgi:hypothetical protein
MNLTENAHGILTRLQIDATAWQTTLEKLLRPNKRIGSDFGTSSRLSEVATQRGTKFLKNVTGRQ